MRRAFVLGILVALTGACGTGGPGTSGEISHPSGPALVIGMRTEGGLLPTSVRYREAPAFTLVGDGRALAPGPQIELYPPPALPSVTVRSLNEQAMQKLLTAARDAGLMRGDRTIAQPPGRAVADAGEVVFTVTADGRTSVTRVDALGTGDETGERAMIEAFRQKLGDLDGWLPKGSVSADHAYDIEALRVVSFPYRDVDDPQLAQAAKKWPLATPLASFGQAIENQDARCGVVKGAELASLLEALRVSNELTPWVSDSKRYQLAVRPLTPDETSC